MTAPPSGDRPERVRMPRRLRQLLDGWVDDPGEPVAVEVDHAPECAHWHGAPCNCEPTVRMVPNDRKER